MGEPRVCGKSRQHNKTLLKHINKYENQRDHIEDAPRCQPFRQQSHRKQGSLGDRYADAPPDSC